MRLVGGTPPGMPHTGPNAKTPGEPRFIGDDVIDGWLKAASQRKPPAKRDRATLRNYLHARSPWRWRRLQRDLRWAERQLLRLGMNPEDARWIL
jgi:hypothetical protein